MTLDMTEIILACKEDSEYDGFAVQARAIQEDCANRAMKECEAVIKKHAGIAAKKIVKLYKKNKKEKTNGN